MKKNIRYLHRISPIRKFNPVTHIFASTDDNAIRSIDSKSSPYMIENEHSSLYIPVISGFFKTSVFFPRRTSRILLIGTVIQYKI